MTKTLFAWTIWERPLLVLVWTWAVGVLMWGSDLDVMIQLDLYANYHQGFNDVMRSFGEMGKGTFQAGMCVLVGLGWAVWNYRATGKVGYGPRMVLMAIPVFAVAGIINWVLKWGIGRGRPKEFLWNGSSPYRMEPFAWPFDAQWFSFPSGHACSTFAVAVWLGLAFPRARWVLWVVAVVMGVSRFLAVTPHFAGDVVAGAGLGAAVAMVIWNAREQQRG